MSQSHIKRTMLGNEHFLEVQQLIWNARASYENLGIALGLVYVDIVDIKQTHHYNTENCFNAVLVEVLNQGVTQEDLANALESKTVHEGQLAKKVRATTFSSSSGHGPTNRSPPVPEPASTPQPDIRPTPNVTAPLPEGDLTDNGVDPKPPTLPLPEHEQTLRQPDNDRDSPPPTPLLEPVSSAPPQPDPPKIVKNPVGQKKHVKDSAVLTVKTSGSGTLSYQWVRDEVPITDEQQLGCAGAMTNSLKFNSLLPEHSGNYMCIVTNSSGVSRSKPAELQVISTMNFMEFFQEASEHQDGIITIAETLQERFHEYLNECGYKYHDDRTLEDVLEEICEDATVDYDKATIDFQSLTQKIEPQENIGDSVEYTNNGAEDQERSFNRTVEYSVGSESCKTTVHGWSTSGEVHASFKGVGAKAATTHTTSTSKMHKQAEGTKTTHTFNESIYVPSESKVRVTVKKKVKVTNCKVYGLSVTFQRKKAKFNCIIQSGQKRKNRKEEFKIKNIFSDNVDVKSSTVTVRMGGNYIWFEPSVYIDKHTSDI